MLHFVTVFQWIKDANSEPKPQNLISKTNMVHLHSLSKWCLGSSVQSTMVISELREVLKKLFQSLNQGRITFIDYSVNNLNMIYTNWAFTNSSTIRKIRILKDNMKVIFAILILVSVASANELRDWCNDTEDYFNQHCPITKGDYNGCCLCTQVKSNAKLSWKIEF